jgi:hypothetical protein
VKVKLFVQVKQRDAVFGQTVKFASGMVASEDSHLDTSREKDHVPVVLSTAHDAIFKSLDGVPGETRRTAVAGKVKNHTLKTRLLL